ncbi:MAG: hypothetical protein ACK2T6_03700 [Anaerolineae bacterium]|jgi:hypothetical protein
MKVRTNEALVAKRRRTALLLSLGGIAVLGVGLAINMKGWGGAAGASGDLAPGVPFASLPYFALVIGTIMSWIGISISDRWSLPPRADLALEHGLKGAGQAYTLYNWLLPAEHVLLAPWGLAVIAVNNCDGPVEVKGSRWRDARPIWRRALSVGRRPVRDPRRRLGIETAALASAIAARDADSELGDVTVEGLAVFSQPAVSVSATEPSVPALRTDELAAWLRDKAKSPSMSPGRRRRLERLLDEIANERLER